jgi:hypothetical protein
VQELVKQVKHGQAWSTPVNDNASDALHWLVCAEKEVCELEVSVRDVAAVAVAQPLHNLAEEVPAAEARHNAVSSQTSGSDIGGCCVQQRLYNSSTDPPQPCCRRAHVHFAAKLNLASYGPDT